MVFKQAFPGIFAGETISHAIPVPSPTISGIVTFDGTPMAGVSVVGLNFSVDEVTTIDITDENGYYQVTFLFDSVPIIKAYKSAPPGSYRGIDATGWTESAENVNIAVIYS